MHLAALHFALQQALQALQLDISLYQAPPIAGICMSAGMQSLLLQMLPPSPAHELIDENFSCMQDIEHARSTCHCKIAAEHALHRGSVII